MRKTICLVILALAASSASLTASASGTTTYKGTGTYVTARTLLPLANGGAALQITNDTLATFKPSESGFMYGDCAGLGYLGPDGEATLKAICNFDVSATDGFTVSIDGDPKTGAPVQVLGGRGKFEKAKGTGSIRQTYVDGNRGSYEYEFQITTP